MKEFLDKKIFPEQFINETLNLDRLELLEKIREKLDESMTQNQAIDLLDQINMSLDKFREEIRDWSPTDRLLWFIKDAYIAGFLYATDTMVKLLKEELK